MGTKWEVGLFATAALGLGLSLGLVRANNQVGEAKIKALQELWTVASATQARAEVLQSFRSLKPQPASSKPCERDHIQLTRSSVADISSKSSGKKSSE
jgi:hypothetical protein